MGPNTHQQVIQTYERLNVKVSSKTLAPTLQASVNNFGRSSDYDNTYITIDAVS